MFSVLGSFNALLRELVAEFTLTDNSANTTTSLLRSLCHYDDSVLLGSWLQETDHKSIEDQVVKHTRKYNYKRNLKQWPYGTLSSKEDTLGYRTVRCTFLDTYEHLRGG